VGNIKINYKEGLSHIWLVAFPKSADQKEPGVKV
jgi:hypothetical protein